MRRQVDVTAIEAVVRSGRAAGMTSSCGSGPKCAVNDPHLSSRPDGGVTQDAGDLVERRRIVDQFLAFG